MTAGLAASGVLALGTTPTVVDPGDPDPPPPIIIEIEDVLEDLSGSIVFLIEVIVTEQVS